MGPEQKEGRAMHFIGQVGPLRNLLLTGPPLLEADDLKALVEQAVHIARNRAMLFHDTRRYPIGNPRPFKNIVIDGPNLSAGGIGLPPRVTWGGENGVLDRKNEPTARHQKSPYGNTHGPEVFYVVQRQRAVDQIEGGVGKLKALDV